MIERLQTNIWLYEEMTSRDIPANITGPLTCKTFTVIVYTVSVLILRNFTEIKVA